jgi:transposase
MMRYELTDYEWAAIRPMLPNKARGVRRGTIDGPQPSAGCCDPAHHGAIYRIAMAHAPPATTVSSAGEGRECGAAMDALAAAHDAAVQMIDTSIVRVH